MQTEGVVVTHIRFPGLPREAAEFLARALTYEAHAGIAMRDGKRSAYEHLRTLHQTAWERFYQAVPAYHPARNFFMHTTQKGVACEHRTTIT